MSRIVATLNQSAGNAEVGEMWIETKIFNRSEKIGNIVDWAKSRANKAQTNPENHPLHSTLRITEGD